MNNEKPTQVFVFFKHFDGTLCLKSLLILEGPFWRLVWFIPTKGHIILPFGHSCAYISWFFRLLSYGYERGEKFGWPVSQWIDMEIASAIPNRNDNIYFLENIFFNSWFHFSQIIRWKSCQRIITLFLMGKWDYFWFYVFTSLVCTLIVIYIHSFIKKIIWWLYKYYLFYICMRIYDSLSS